jgi:hypothetical protein
MKRGSRGRSRTGTRAALLPDSPTARVVAASSETRSASLEPPTFRFESGHLLPLRPTEPLECARDLFGILLRS